jgi:hypothetical protein
MVERHSQNGWPVLETPPPPVEIPGTDIKVRVRPGDVATVLTYVAARFHREVEPLDLPVREDPGADEWGWAWRPVRGQSKGFSNHASGCAVDLNATRHPRGVSDTFSAKQIRAVRKILASTFDGRLGRNVVRWGEDYTTTVDGMHFEINADAAAIARVARRIRAKQAEESQRGATQKTEQDQQEDDMKAVFVGPVKPYRQTDRLLLVSAGGPSVVVSARHKALLITLGVPEEAVTWPRSDYDALLSLAEDPIEAEDIARIAAVVGDRPRQT